MCLRLFQPNYSTQSHDRNRAIIFLRAVIHSVDRHQVMPKNPFSKYARNLQRPIVHLLSALQFSTNRALGFINQNDSLSILRTPNSTNKPDLPSKASYTILLPPSLLSHLSIPHPHFFHLQHQPRTSTRTSEPSQEPARTHNIYLFRCSINYRQRCSRDQQTALPPSILHSALDN